MAAARWLLTFVATAALLGQAPQDRLSFEVASIKPSKNFDQGGGTRWQPGGILQGTNVAVRDLMLGASPGAKPDDLQRDFLDGLRFD